METFPEVGGVLVWVLDDLDAARFVEIPDVGEEGVKVPNDCIGELQGVSGGSGYDLLVEEERRTISSRASDVWKAS